MTYREGLFSPNLQVKAQLMGANKKALAVEALNFFRRT